MVSFRCLVAGLALAAVSGCGSTGGGVAANTRPELDAQASKVIKVSYIRFQWSRQRSRWAPEYRIMLSESWKRQYGANPREPFSKLYRNPYRAESVPDAQMQLLVREMLNRGFADLQGREATSISLDDLQRLERMPQAANDVVQGWRIMTIETETMKKTVVRADNIESQDSQRKFAMAEWEVIKFANQYTVQINVETQPVIPGEPR